MHRWHVTDSRWRSNIPTQRMVVKVGTKRNDDRARTGDGRAPIGRNKQLRLEQAGRGSHVLMPVHRRGNRLELDTVPRCIRLAPDNE